MDTSLFTSSGRVRATITKRSRWSGVCDWPSSWASVSSSQPRSRRVLAACWRIKPESSTMESCFRSLVCRLKSVSRCALPLTSKAKFKKEMTESVTSSVAMQIWWRCWLRCSLVLHWLLTNSISLGTDWHTASCSSSNLLLASSCESVTSRKGSGSGELSMKESHELLEELEAVEEVDTVELLWWSLLSSSSLLIVPSTDCLDVVLPLEGQWWSWSYMGPGLSLCSRDSWVVLESVSGGLCFLGNTTGLSVCLRQGGTS